MCKTKLSQTKTNMQWLQIQHINTPLDAFVVLDFSNDLDLLASFAQNLSDFAYTVTTANKRCEHDVDTLFHAELQI